MNPSLPDSATHQLLRFHENHAQALRQSLEERPPSASPAPIPASSTPNLDYLREQVNRLKQLLDDPHPGLFTWSEAYADRMQAIADFWKGGDE